MSHMPDAPSPTLSLAQRLAADRSGVTAVITALVLTILMGFCGLAIDVVMWEVNQRTMQGAADQSALAGATAYRNAAETGPLGDSTTAQNAAYATAIRSGYAASAVAVAAYNGGACKSDGCLQVTISQPQPRFFTAIFLKTPVTASASAVGTCKGCESGASAVGSNGGNPCVMALDSSGKGVVTVSGTPTMSLISCNLYNNSPQTDATILNGGGIVQGCTVTNACGSQAFLAQPNTPSGKIDVPVVNNASPAPDPYAGLVPPNPSPPCKNLPSPPINVPSGDYCGGSKFQNLTITFAPNAVIYVDGGLDLHSGSTSLTGTGVILYVQSDGSSSEGSTINATTTINISAPTTGPYAGVVAWFAGSSPVSYSGANGSAFKGAIYAPTADVTYTGNAASTSTCTRLVAASVSLSGTSTATFDNSGCPTVAGPVLTSSGAGGTTPYTGAPVLVQ